MTLNYVDVYTIVRDIVEERTFNLIEAVAEEIASTVLSSFDVAGVTVRVRKPHVSLGGLLRTVEVEIERWADEGV